LDDSPALGQGVEDALADRFHCIKRFATSLRKTLASLSASSADIQASL
jgi:hypothetical protein